MHTAVVAAIALATAPAGPLRFDFETGDLQGWAVVEGRFDLVVCDRATFRNTGEPYNKQGLYYLCTIERAGYVGDDTMTGVIESPVFVLTGPTVSFLIGGGSHADTYVALCRPSGEELRRATGADTETMHRVIWDAPELVGEQVVVRVVDRNRGSWGHVTLDDLSAEGIVDAEATVARRRAVAVARFLELAIAPIHAAASALTEEYGPAYPEGESYLARAENLKHQALGADDPASLDALEAEANLLRREVLLSHPAIRGRSLLFVIRPQYLPDHHNTETMFQTGEINTASFRGGGALATLDLSTGETRTLLELTDGIARDPDVSFDGERIVFSMRRDPNDDYHVYEIGSDGTGLRQLTFGAGLSDIDPTYLPDGRIAFTSTREPKYCMCNRHIMGNLFVMEADGANVRQIGKSTLHEGHSALLPDGRLLYDRWEYVDRNFGDAQGLWACSPDGTGHSLVWGNNTPSPGGVIDGRPIPGTAQYIATFTSCHDRPWGALAIIDPSLGLDGCEPVVRTWPSDAIDLVMVGDFDTFLRCYPKYEDPFPLGHGFFLCSRMTGEGERMGIYLVDVYGNEELVHVEGAGCYDPMPIAPRPTPPIVPERVALSQTDGWFYVADVYLGTGMERVPRGSVKWIRVVESPEKRHWTYPSWPGQGQEAPAMGWHDFNNKRILGTAPVEADGSAYFAVPPDRFVYFQLLDERGMMIQSMRSGTIVRPNELAGCIGCHDNRLTTVPNRGAKAFHRGPSALEPWYGPEREFSYAAEVQPVLDRHCVRCHDYGTDGGEVLNLCGDRLVSFNVSYTELWMKGYVGAIGAGPAQVQMPYSWGSHASRLVRTLLEPHYDVALDPESLARIVTWVDINAPYYPSYASVYPNNLHGRCPLGNAELSRLRELTGVDFLDGQNEHEESLLINLTRPELSPLLRALPEPEYAEALDIVRRGRDQLANTPREDMPGCTLLGLDVERERRYEERAAIEAGVRRAILAGERLYPYRPQGHSE